MLLNITISTVINFLKRVMSVDMPEYRDQYVVSDHLSATSIVFETHPLLPVAMLQVEERLYFGVKFSPTLLSFQFKAVLIPVHDSHSIAHHSKRFEVMIMMANWELRAEFQD